MDDPERILAILDRCAKDFHFPMLDNGYVYPAATHWRHWPEGGTL